MKGLLPNTDAALPDRERCHRAESDDACVNRDGGIHAADERVGGPVAAKTRQRRTSSPS